ncbi:MAG: TIGR03790 family protein [Verrucomicrobiota bacterium]
MRLRRFLVLGCSLVLATGTRGADAPADTLASRVVILANSADADSVALAHYYAEKRGVPVENIIALKLPATEIITREEFDTQLYQPFQDELIRLKWLDGLPARAAAGVVPNARSRYAILGNRISYLVVCRGVPLIVGGNDAPDDNPQFTARNSQLRQTAAAVDSELALLPRSGWPITAFVANPVFNRDRPASLLTQQIVKVGRLDGPTLADARGLVDHALAAEATGLVGRGYIDIGGPHAEGDKWLEETARELAALGFDRDVDRANPATFAPESRFDAPALYFGWYSATVNGPFVREDFRFPPGAVALHIFSFSASTLRDPKRAWSPALVARGVTATFGNVSEPFLQFTHQPQLILRSLARGDTLGDAAAYAIPYFSWMGVLIGDPLYRPFKVTLDEQWRDRANLPTEQQPYVLLRRMRLLAAAGQSAEAIALGQAAQRVGFNLPVALTLADVQRAAGDQTGVRRSLAPALAPETSLAAADAPLLATLAARYAELDEPRSAVQAWQRLLAFSGLPAEDRTVWLRLAVNAAHTAKDRDLAAAWDAELGLLTRPAEPKK